MVNFKTEEDDAELFDEKTPVYKIREVGIHAIFMLNLAKSLLIVGFVLVLFNSLEIVEPRSYYGDDTWFTNTVYSIGLMLAFIFIPWLYFSSFRNFKKNIDYWDKEMFWILPLFIFSTYFLFCEKIDASLLTFRVAILVITIFHITFAVLAWMLMKKRMKGSLAKHHYQYLISMKYLTTYYVILTILLYVINPLQYAFDWIRTHI